MMFLPERQDNLSINDNNSNLLEINYFHLVLPFRQLIGLVLTASR
jgi:hypothetical protein